MKKSVLFLASAASLALASCSNEAVEMNQGEAISFRTAFEMPKGRASEITNSNMGEKIGSITVDAVNQFGDYYFKGVVFNRDGNNFISGNKYYWPNDGSSLTFTAYNGDGKYMNGAEAYTPATDAANQIDLIYSKGATGSKAKQADGVTLEFQHALSQVEVRAYNSNPAYVIEVANVKLGNLGATSKFDINLDAPAWGAISGVTAYTNTAAKLDADGNGTKLNGVAASMMFDGGNMMVIPQKVNAWAKNAEDKYPTLDATDKAGYIALYVRIHTKDDAWVYPAKDATYTEGNKQGFAWVAVPVAFDFEAGKHYIYTLGFGEGAGITDPTEPDPKPVLAGEIKLNVDVKGWVEQNVPAISAAL